MKFIKLKGKLKHGLFEGMIFPLKNKGMHRHMFPDYKRKSFVSRVMGGNGEKFNCYFKQKSAVEFEIDDSELENVYFLPWWDRNGLEILQGKLKHAIQEHKLKEKKRIDRMLGIKRGAK